MRLPAFLARLWSRLTGSMSIYVHEPTPEEEKAMQEALESALVDGPDITLSGHFDDTEAARMIHRVEAQEREGPEPQS